MSETEREAKLRQIREHVGILRLRQDIMVDLLDKLINLAERQKNDELIVILRDTFARIQETRAT